MTEVRKVKLAYDVYEPAGGADNSLSPVIYLHGVTGSKDNFGNIPQIIADKTRRKGYAYDARNHGDSEHTSTYSLADNVVDLFDFMDTIRASRAVLIGHSMGGTTAITAALKKPKKVEMIFVEDMFVKKWTKDIVELVGAIINISLNVIKTIPKELVQSEAVKYCVDSIYSQMPSDLIICEKERLYNSRFLSKRNPSDKYDVKYNKKVVLNAVMNIGKDLEDPIGQYYGPAYFLYGSNSPFGVGNHANDIQKHFPKSELIEFEGALHEVHLAFPEKFVEILLQRLKSQTT